MTEIYVPEIKEPEKLFSHRAEDKSQIGFYIGVTSKPDDISEQHIIDSLKYNAEQVGNTDEYEFHQMYPQTLGSRTWTAHPDGIINSYENTACAPEIALISKNTGKYEKIYCIWMKKKNLKSNEK